MTHVTMMPSSHVTVVCASSAGELIKIPYDSMGAFSEHHTVYMYMCTCAVHTVIDTWHKHHCIAVVQSHQI